MNPYQKTSNAYQKAAVTTKDQGALILMMYEGAIKFMKQACLKVDKVDNEGVHDALTKAKTIISELMGSLNLDVGGEVGKNLQSLYTYMYNKLIDANVNKDKAAIEEVIVLMDELRDGWAHITQKNNAKPAATAGIRTMNIKG